MNDLDTAKVALAVVRHLWIGGGDMPPFERTSQYIDDYMTEAERRALYAGVLLLEPDANAT